MASDNESDALSSTEMDSDEEFDALVLAATTIAQFYHETYVLKNVMRDSALRGHAYIMELIQGHNECCRSMLHMDQYMFLRLCETFKERGLLRGTRGVSVEKQMGIFLMTIGHNERNSMICERFQHSSETISRHFNSVLKAMAEFSASIIRPPSFEVVSSYIRYNPNYWRFFKDCIGALNGTHVDAFIPLESQVPFRGRKGTCTQNGLAVCSFNMFFTFVNAGWEGSANDSRVLLEMISNPNNNFPHPPKGKYYVADGGYASMRGYLIPYHGIRYHLKEFPKEDQAKTRKEMFNHKHSSLRNVIERCFGVLKARFPILKAMPSYQYTTQVLIVISCMAIHNFIRQQTAAEWLMDQYDKQDLIFDEDTGDRNNSIEEPIRGATGQREMEAIRDLITDAISYSNGGIPD